MTQPQLSATADGTDGLTAILAEVDVIRSLTVDALYEAAMAEHADGDDERSDWLMKVRSDLGEALAHLDDLADLLQIEPVAATDD